MRTRISSVKRKDESVRRENQLILFFHLGGGAKGNNVFYHCRKILLIFPLSLSFSWFSCLPDMQANNKSYKTYGEVTQKRKVSKTKMWIKKVVLVLWKPKSKLGESNRAIRHRQEALVICYQSWNCTLLSSYDCTYASGDGEDTLNLQAQNEFFL